MKGLTDIPGILVGHVTDTRAITGCTVILCGNDAVGGIDVRGSATGSCDVDVLDPGHVTPNVNAIVLAGGSAFGLETAAGVRRALEKRGVGYRFGGVHIPIVAGAILFDLGIGSSTVRPDREMGERAVEAAADRAV
ncbi:MAG: P1 family peptidase, partial [Acidobacteriota bacterium]|nr:P1 family peptidase [Acidobacteriota bacterium]